MRRLWTLALMLIASSAGAQALSEQRQRLDRLNTREAELAIKSGANLGKLSRLLGGLQLYSRNPPPALLTPADEALNAMRGAILIKAMIPEMKRRADAFAYEARDLADVRRKAAGAAERLFIADSAQAEREARIEALIAVRTERAASTVTATTITLRQPLAQKPVQRFADGGPGGQSGGWTWQVKAGDVVVAPGSGLVEYADQVEGWRQVVIIDLGGGYRAVLAGLDGLKVRPGQNITTGQTLGVVAAANTSEARQTVELLMEIRKNGERIDPGPLLSRDQR